MYLWSLTSESYRHLYTINLEDQCVQSVKTRIRLVTFYQTFIITSAESWSFRLKLIPIALSLTLTSLRIETPTICESLQFRNACSHRSVTRSRNCEIGSLSSLSDGDNRRTVGYATTVLNRLYCLVISFTILNL